MPEEELNRRLRMGDPRAFDALVDRHYGSCLRVAWGRLGNREDAEDVVQEALVRAIWAIRRGKAPRSVRPWLIKIVIQRCRTQLAKQTRRRHLFAVWKRDVEAEPRYQAPAEPGGLQDRRLDGALEELTPALREAFLLKHVEELTYEEMSQLTGVGVSALKMRVKRATEQLLEHLNPEVERFGSAGPDEANPRKESMDHARTGSQA